MGLRDVLFGGRKRPVRSVTDKLGAMSAADLTMQTELGATSTGRAAIAVRSMDASAFVEARNTLEQMLHLAGSDLGTVTEVTKDDYGFVWIVLHDDDFTDLVACAQMAASTLTEEGFRDQLLCAVFPFTSPDVTWVYAFKRGSFYAFAARAGNTRDLALELRAHALLERELPLEKELEYRYPLWGAPV